MSLKDLMKRIVFYKGVFIDTDTNINDKTFDGLRCKVNKFEEEFNEWCDSFSFEELSKHPDFDTETGMFNVVLPGKVEMIKINLKVKL